MGKRELIDYICEINTSAKPEFLADFSEDELSDYLGTRVSLKKGTGESGQIIIHFENTDNLNDILDKINE